MSCWKWAVRGGRGVTVHSPALYSSLYEEISKNSFISSLFKSLVFHLRALFLHFMFRFCSLSNDSFQRTNLLCSCSNLPAHRYTLILKKAHSNPDIGVLPQAWVLYKRSQSLGVLHSIIPDPSTALFWTDDGPEIYWHHQFKVTAPDAPIGIHRAHSGPSTTVPFILLANNTSNGGTWSSTICSLPPHHPLSCILRYFLQQFLPGAIPEGLSLMSLWMLRISSWIVAH